MDKTTLPYATLSVPSPTYTIPSPPSSLIPPYLSPPQAIRDGVIEASVEHEKSFMQSRENMDIYCTKEPHDAFHQRITFCLDLYGQSVKVRRP